MQADMLVQPMDKESLTHIRQWFLEYSATFEMDTEEDRGNIELKRIHTGHVEDNSVLIARGEGLSEPLALLAQAAAILHDVGRFPQYRQYRSFNDASTLNHGELGAKVLRKEDVLCALKLPEREAVISAVHFHNTYAMPDIEDETALGLLRVLRDADKLDIWRVMAEYYELPPSERSPAVAIHLEDRPTYSPVMLEKLARAIPCSYSDATVLNDLKFMNLSWAYSLNFSTTSRLMLERRLAERIASTLPDTHEIAEAMGSLMSHLRKQAESAKPNH